MTRIERLRALFDAHNIDAYYIPKVDEFMGEYIRPFDERLAWISGFTGSAGFALITRDRAALFVDSRYDLQAVKEAPEFEIVKVPQNELLDLIDNNRLGFDPNLLPIKTFEKWQAQLGQRLISTPNLIDQIWHDRPAPQSYELRELPAELAGQSTADKIKALASQLEIEGVDAFLSNNPESIAWLLNIRGGEIAMLPAPMGYMILHRSGAVDVFGVQAPEFACGAKFYPLDALPNALQNFQGTMAYNASALPIGRLDLIQNPKPITDPIIAAKARKNPAEIRASQSAHDQDGLAMIKFLAWLDAQDPTTLDELKAAKRLLAFREENPDFRVDSFGCISAWGANAANPHYHASEASFAHFQDNGVCLVDSGGHYPGATTDITRTIAIGAGIEAAKEPYTQVLEGLARISQARFPQTARGCDIDPFAREALWQSRRNYGHGTGHGVGAELSVHEGPASISPRGVTILEQGMILSLEPGYYQAGDFGIRLENLAYITMSEEYYQFETLSFVPLDTRLIAPEHLSARAKKWLNTYHNKTLEKHNVNLDETTSAWLKTATKPI